MIRLLTDNDFNGAIYKGLKRKCPDLDIVRVQDIGFAEKDDPAILEWATTENRILLTHDFNTIPKHAYQRLDLGLRLPGVLQIPQDISIRQAIDEILIFALCSEDDEWEGQVRYIPL
jgi:hypothetical protein